MCAVIRKFIAGRGQVLEQVVGDRNLYTSFLQQSAREE